MNFYSVELPYQTNASGYYATLANLPWAIWLDSCGMARYDIMVADPSRRLVFKKNDGYDPFLQMRKLLGERVLPKTNVPFAGGALGYWSYDLARRKMPIPKIASAENELPLMEVGVYDWALVVDHQMGTTQLVSHLQFSETINKLPEILRRLKCTNTHPVGDFSVHGEITSNLSKKAYANAFRKIQNYLVSGDCYQVNLAQQFKAKAQGDAYSAYLRLRSKNPAPYSAFMNFSDRQILSNSPECFIRIQGSKVLTKPIKGTRPRNRDTKLDLELVNSLLNDPKDKAENVMIVDLLRSDLGKNCLPGSVRAPHLFEVESYANVHHLVSSIEGELATGKDALDVLRDCFPGGSITGAPKLRAMQIIEQLEPDRRGIYCGAIGYVGFDGNMDTNIAIRTLVYECPEISAPRMEKDDFIQSGFGVETERTEYCENDLMLEKPKADSEFCKTRMHSGVISCWAGGGIVADSEVESEYRETLDKASAMLELLQHYGGKYREL